MKIFYKYVDRDELRRHAKHKKFTRRREWHRWFAWYPVRIDNDELRWLEVLERIGTYYKMDCAEVSSWWEYHYRTIERK